MIVWCLIPVGQQLAALSKQYQDVSGEAQTRSTEALGGIRTVPSFASEPKELNRYADKVGDPDKRHDTNNSNTNNSDKHNNEDTGMIYKCGC